MKILTCGDCGEELECQWCEVCSRPICDDCDLSHDCMSNDLEDEEEEDEDDDELADDDGPDCDELDDDAEEGFDNDDDESSCGNA